METRLQRRQRLQKAVDAAEVNKLAFENTAGYRRASNWQRSKSTASAGKALQRGISMRKGPARRTRRR